MIDGVVPAERWWEERRRLDWPRLWALSSCGHERHSAGCLLLLQASPCRTVRFATAGGSSRRRSCSWAGGDPQHAELASRAAAGWEMRVTLRLKDGQTAATRGIRRRAPEIYIPRRRAASASAPPFLPPNPVLYNTTTPLTCISSFLLLPRYGVLPSPVSTYFLLTGSGRRTFAPADATNMASRCGHSFPLPFLVTAARLRSESPHQREAMGELAFGRCRHSSPAACAPPARRRSHRYRRTRRSETPFPPLPANQTERDRPSGDGIIGDFSFRRLCTYYHFASSAPVPRSHVRPGPKRRRHLPRAAARLLGTAPELGLGGAHG